MALELSILYRGPLSSCNYGCPYCPFAKRQESHAALAGDRTALSRFIDWVAARPAGDKLSILFTPWGEAITRPWYRQAMIDLSHMPQIHRVAVQSNISVPMGWVADGIAEKMGFWATYHPGEVTQSRFLRRFAELRAAGAAASVGVVGLREHFSEIAGLRRALPDDTYLWVNAYDPKQGRPYYSDAEIAFLTGIDPLFALNLGGYKTLGLACGAGHRAITVDGDGDVRRCHFIPLKLGNLYTHPLEQMLTPRSCTASLCHCHIGYVHLDALRLDAIFGDGLLPRIPAIPPTRTMAQARLSDMGDLSLPYQPALALQN